MTTDSMALMELIEKHGDTDFLRELGQWTLQRRMELEVEQKVGAAHHERTDDRTTQRNGYRDRRLETRIGPLSLRIPKLRSGSYFPSFLEPRKKSEHALGTVVQEAYINGVSTRTVDDLVQSMGMTGISKSQVSRLCSELDEQVQAFLERPIRDDWAYGWFDATSVKSRTDGRVVSRAIVVAVGVSAEGRREVLGIAVGPAEKEPFWMAFLRSLVTRGRSGVRLVISDAHIGLTHAIGQVIGATWQRCLVHCMRNALAHVPRNQHQMVAAVIRTAFVQETRDDAVTQWRETADRLRKRVPTLGDLMDDAEADVLAFMTFPKEHWRQISSTNPLERINKEITRRTNVVGIFPNDRAIIRLGGALVNEQSDEWQVTRKYMSHESVQRVLNPSTEQQRLPAAVADKVA